MLLQERRLSKNILREMSSLDFLSRRGKMKTSLCKYMPLVMPIKVIVDNLSSKPIVFVLLNFCTICVLFLVALS